MNEGTCLPHRDHRPWYQAAISLFDPKYKHLPGAGGLIYTRCAPRDAVPGLVQPIPRSLRSLLPDDRGPHRVAPSPAAGGAVGSDRGRRGRAAIRRGCAEPIRLVRDPVSAGYRAGARPLRHPRRRRRGGHESARAEIGEGVERGVDSGEHVQRGLGR